MSARSAAQMTLPELFVAAERHIRELVEHLDRNFVPKSDALVRMLEPRSGARTEARSHRTDYAAIHGQVVQLVESEDYTEQVYSKLEEYLRAIDSAVARISIGG
ncbi:MAG: hypothetical protein WD066_15215 [Planctomycetaceae bacterium]